MLFRSIDESWRWRMEGPADGVAAHRAWWSSLVAAVAYAPTVPRPIRVDALGDDGLDAPRARLVDALGEPTAPDAAPVRGAALRPWVLVAALLLLLLEWASRRLRGAP